MKKRFINGIITCSLAGLSLSMTLSLNAFASASEDVSVNKIDSKIHCLN